MSRILRGLRTGESLAEVVGCDPELLAFDWPINSNGNHSYVTTMGPRMGSRIDTGFRSGPSA